MKHILILCLLHVLIGVHPSKASSNVYFVEKNTFIGTEKSTPKMSLMAPANGDGLFKVGLITFGVGAATTLVGSIIRWSSQDQEAKKRAGAVQLTGLCLMGIPLGIAVSSKDGRVSTSSTRQSRGNRRWRG